jgi:hypothetical protein
MAGMNALIAMGYRAPDIVGALSAGRNQRAIEEEAARAGERRNALAQYGGAAMQGDQNALNVLAGYDPELAFGLMRGLADERRDDARLGMDRQSTAARIEALRQDAAFQAAEWAAGVDAAEAERAYRTAELEGRRLLAWYDAGPDVWVDKTRGTEYEGVAHEAFPYEVAPEFDGIMAGLAERRTASNSRASLNPIWGTDAEGGRSVVQLSESGVAIPTQFPDGFTPNKGLERIDAGTEWILYDETSRQIVGRIPKNNFEAESEKAQGRATGEVIGAAAAGLPMQSANLDRITAAADEILNDPDLATVLGPVDSRLPRFTQARADAQAKIDRFTGQTFPLAIDTLRGLGAASNMEGLAAQRAVANMDQTQSPEQFKAFLQEAVAHIRRGFEVAERKAGGDFSPSAPDGVPDWMVHSDVRTWTPEQMAEAERIWGLR